MLELMGKPKLVEMTSGEVQEVHTQFTVRAAELMDLYSGLGDLAVSIDDRLDTLLNVKVTKGGPHFSAVCLSWLIDVPASSPRVFSGLFANLTAS